MSQIKRKSRFDRTVSSKHNRHHFEGTNECKGEKSEKLETWPETGVGSGRTAQIGERVAVAVKAAGRRQQTVLEEGALVVVVVAIDTHFGPTGADRQKTMPTLGSDSADAISRTAGQGDDPVGGGGGGGSTRHSFHYDSIVCVCVCVCAYYFLSKIDRDQYKNVIVAPVPPRAPTEKRIPIDDDRRRSNQRRRLR